MIQHHGSLVLAKKTAFLELLKEDPAFHSCIQAFTVPYQTTDEIDAKGCQVMAVRFDGKCIDSLSRLR